MVKTMITATALLALSVPAYALSTFDGSYTGVRTVKHASRACQGADVAWKVVNGFVGDNEAVAAEVGPDGAFKGTGVLHRGNNYIPVKFSGHIVGNILTAQADAGRCHAVYKLTKQ
jgi:hypothetical protein